MRKSYCMLMVIVLLLFVAGTIQAKDDSERPTPFKDTVRAAEMEPNDDCTIANPLNIDDPMAAAISPEGDNDWFEFQASAGDCVTFAAAPGEGQVGGDTRMWLWADDCVTQLDFDDDGGDGLYPLIEYEFADAGTYYIEVDEYGDNGIIDAYVLLAAECPPPPEENGSTCNLLNICYDWDFAEGDHGFVPVLCDPLGVGVWEYGNTTYVPGAPGTVWGTILEGDYPTGAGDGLLSPAFTVVAGQCDYMEIKHYVHAERFSETSTIYDGCNVTVNGIVINPFEGYDGTAGTAPFCVAEEDVFAGNSNNGPSRTWGTSCFDLTEYVGQEIQVSFDFGSDGSVVYPGWYLAYVKVGSGAQPVPVEDSSWGSLKSLFR